MERIKYLKYNGRILPLVFDYNMTTTMIETWLSANEDMLFPHLDLCEAHSCTVYSPDNHTISVAGDEDSISLEIDYTQIIKHTWL